jgi:hypothetical protein
MAEPELFATHVGRNSELHVDRYGSTGKLFVRVVEGAEDAGVVLGRRAALNLADALMSWRLQEYGLDEGPAR